MLVDCQSHLFPSFYPELLRRGGSGVSVDATAGGVTLVFAAGFSLRVALEPYEPAAVIRRMDEAGIDVSVVSVNMPGPELLRPDAAREASRRCNEFVAETCAASRGRLVGLGTIPFDDAEHSLLEIARAPALGLRGFVLPSNIAGRPVDGVGYEPIYEALASAGLPVVLHPAVPSWSTAIGDYSMVPMLGFMADTSIAMLRLILSGLLDRHPRLQVVHPHCGGVLPYLMPRVVEQTETKRRGREHIRRSPAEYYREVYLDLVSPSPEHMAFAAGLSRPDRLLFGTDAPWVDVREMVRCFADARLSDETRELAAWRNAVRLFRIG